MSLISGANFVAPLRSKVQVVGIFALAVLVAVLRLAGSGHSANSGARSSDIGSYAQAPAKTTIAADDVDSYLASRRRPKARAESTAVGDVTVERLLQGEEPDPSARIAHRNSDDNNPQPEKLNDIKRSLGLE
ncbi:MAG: hypothetical protein RIS36_2284 [Pseudomonadota bacterium]|jgi:hypothetical protein